MRLRLLLSLSIVMIGAWWARGVEPAPTKVGVDELKSMLALELDLLTKNTKSVALFRRGAKRLVLTGYVAALVGHEGANAKTEPGLPWGALREAGIKLTKACQSNDFDAAQSAGKSILDFPVGAAAAAEPIKLLDHLELEPFMFVVNDQDNSLHAAVTADGPIEPSKAKELATRAQLVSAIGRLSRSYESQADWQKWCDAMSQSADELASHLHAGDRSAAKTAHAKLAQSCIDCHKVYHPK